MQVPKRAFSLYRTPVTTTSEPTLFVRAASRPRPVRALLCTLGALAMFPLAARAQGFRAGTTNDQRDPNAPPTPTPQATPPRIVEFVEATYPAEATAQHLEATVILRLTIDAQGHVTADEVTEGAGHGFDEAAVAAARKFVFAPAQRDGQPIPSRDLAEELAGQKRQVAA